VRGKGEEQSSAAVYTDVSSPNHCNRIHSRKN